MLLSTVLHPRRVVGALLNRPTHPTSQEMDQRRNAAQNMASLTAPQRRASEGHLAVITVTTSSLALPAMERGRGDSLGKVSV
jgi:hypothetical protein